jgi:hypothetical protein
MGIDDLENFAAHGGSSIRARSTNADCQDTLALLDAAQANGVTVALCLSMPAERHWFSYDDTQAVAEQLQWMREEVTRYRNHSALLTWIFGNELNNMLMRSPVPRVCSQPLLSDRQGFAGVIHRSPRGLRRRGRPKAESTNRELARP